MGCASGVKVSLTATTRSLYTFVFHSVELTEPKP